MKTWEVKYSPGRSPPKIHLTKTLHHYRFISRLEPNKKHTSLCQPNRIRIIKSVDDYSVHLTSKEKIMKEKTIAPTLEVDVETIDFEEIIQRVNPLNQALTKKYMKKIKKRIQTFSDLTKISDSSMDTVYWAVEREQWLTSLKGVDNAILKKVQKGVSKRSAIILCEDIDVHHVDKPSEM